VVKQRRGFSCRPKQVKRVNRTSRKDICPFHQVRGATRTENWFRRGEQEVWGRQQRLKGKTAMMPVNAEKIKKGQTWYPGKVPRGGRD